jgi:hypothetical protein
MNRLAKGSTSISSSSWLPSRNIPAIESEAPSVWTGAVLIMEAGGRGPVEVQRTIDDYQPPIAANIGTDYYRPATQPFTTYVGRSNIHCLDKVRADAFVPKAGNVRGLISRTGLRSA